MFSDAEYTFIIGEHTFSDAEHKKKRPAGNFFPLLCANAAGAEKKLFQTSVRASSPSPLRACVYAYIFKLMIKKSKKVFVNKKK